MADWRKIRASVWRSWLDGLPDEIYDKRDTAHIVRLLDALCGDNGVGYLRKRLILKRLQTSLYETRYSDLDRLYSAMFDLPRLECEQYEYTEDSLLIWSQISEMNIKDAHYRKRIWDYMLSFQYGGTVKGVALAAQAAVGLPCAVLDGCIYYRSLGVDEGEQSEDSLAPIDFDGKVDFNGATIVVMTDQPLTAEQQLSLSNVTSRLRPVDVHYTFMTRSELMEGLAFSDIEDDYIPIQSVESSSDWWHVARIVTGRPDWSLGAVGNEWVEPNVAKEAPQQLLTNRQESEYDFSSMVRSCTASSEHVGRYNRFQREIFKSLDSKEATVLQKASNALSQASSKMITAGYYGSSSVIDGAYPLSYSSEMTPFFMESGRSHRFWSSDEREGSEWIDIELKRLVPLNRVSMSIFKKPLRVRLYYSSYVDGGARVWVPARDRRGRDLSFTYPEWGDSENGEMVEVFFDTVPVKADAVRVEFERLDIPYREVLDSSMAYEQVDFRWSVECSDISLGYSIKSIDEFVQTTYEDMFGNRVDTELRVMEPSRAIDGDGGTYWLSQPNVGETAVEYLIVKVADEPTRVNFVELEAVYAGCQMNIYSTDGEEPAEWFPYPQVYQLRSERYELPLRKVTYLKFEFTSLCATPYDSSVKGSGVVTRRFPWDVRNYCDERFGESYKASDAEMLLSSPEAVYDDGSIQNQLGIDELYGSDEDHMDYDFYAGTSLAILDSSRLYNSYQDSVVMSYYGDSMLRERVDIPSPDATALGSLSPRYRFSEAGAHQYDEEFYYREMDLAYVVGIKDIKVGFSGRVLLTEPSGTFTLYMQDGRFIDYLDGWGFVNDERLGVLSESLNKFETLNLQSVYPFRTFEFASNQKQPVEKFEHPSDMVEEWHGVGSDVESVEFGVSGTVLKMTSLTSGSGIESEPKLTRSMAIATAQVDVYPLVGGTWQFDCNDLFGENVFSMRYDLKPTRWTTIGVNFVPMPGGSWWDGDYDYRVRIPIVGPIAKGQHIFTPVVDLVALKEYGMVDSDDFEAYTKLRVVYFNGIGVKEMPVDMTDNMELWFKAEQTLGDGVSANGAYDFEGGELDGAYYLYFDGTASADQPMRDYRLTFPHRPYANIGAAPLSDGTPFSSQASRVEFDDEFYLADEGFLSFEITLDSGDGLVRVPNGTVGSADVRFILDYHDQDKDVQLYFYERQLTFAIRDRYDSCTFESSFVSLDENLLAAGTKSKVLVEWWGRGSESITKVDPNDPTQSAVDPDDSKRRKIRVFVDSATPCDCIPNVYDEKHYIEHDSTKVY